MLDKTEFGIACLFVADLSKMVRWHLGVS